MSHSGAHGHSTRDNFWKLMMGALGVVYGDIGTSPLYAVKESLHLGHGIPLTIENVIGVISLIFWSLMIVVVVKYLTFIFMADNEGEGGIMALLALILPKRQDGRPKTSTVLLIFLGLFGAGLLYGDGVITPAISVLSAVEGLEVATPAFQPFIIPITLAILVGLFTVQYRGTEKIGSVFGIVMLLWFSAIAAAGIPWIIREPHVISALNPYHAATFFVRNGWHGFFVLSSVVLVITGAEAAYADMGHFGKNPIRFGWLAIVFPCLMLNYLGQGALVLNRGTDALVNPFYGLVSGWMLYPMVALATAAAIIASQALISGAFSLTQQAIQLGYLPRMLICHTSRETRGQIYVPRINTLLLAVCIALVVSFRTSGNLAAAYGIAVVITMGITSLLFYFVSRRLWNWPFLTSFALLAFFLTVDGAFFIANIVKIRQGGWFPIVIALTVFSVMATWKRGKDYLRSLILKDAKPLDVFLDEIAETTPFRVPGTAVFMTMSPNIAPPALVQHFKHNQVLHEKVLIVSIQTESRPDVSEAERLRVENIGHGFARIMARYGYMQTPNINDILRLAEEAGVRFDLQQISYYLGRETIKPTGESGMAHWRKKLFVFLSRNARPATLYFGLPPNRVIEIGAQLHF